TAGGAAPNAVRVVGQRTSARGNAVPLMFAQAIGIASCDVCATAIAVKPTRTSSYGVAALGKMALSGATIDSYNSALGNYSAATAGASAAIGSNGDVSLSGVAAIRGDVYLAPGKRVSGGGVSGSVSNLPSPLSYPPASEGNAATVNDNANLPAAHFSGGQFSMSNDGTPTLPAGTYYITKFPMSGDSTINFSTPPTPS